MNTIPPVLAETLRNTARRIRRVLIARGLLATLAVVFTGLLIVMGIDAAVTIFNATLRLFLVLTVASAAAFVCYFNLLRPLARRYTFSELASLIEQRHPELQERLSTVV